MELETTNGYLVMISAEDAVLSYYNWTAQVKRGRVTAVLRTVFRGGHQCTDYLHRVVWSRKTGGEWPSEIDHIDRCPLNNRRGNLRRATRKQNTANRTARGVEYDKNVKTKPYRVRIRVGDRRLTFGRYETFEEARAVYEREHQRLFGEWSGTCK